MPPTLIQSCVTRTQLIDVEIIRATHSGKSTSPEAHSRRRSDARGPRPQANHDLPVAV